MQLSHTVSARSVAFDDPNLVSSAGLVPVLALARRCGLHETAGAALTVPNPNAAIKVAAVVAGMVAGADSIEDLDRLRHGGMSRLFTGIRAPSTLGTFLRSFTFGHVRQLDKVATQLLVNLAGHTPLLRDAGRICLVDVDDTVKPTYGYAKQGAGYGYTHVKGLNALIGTLSTPTSAPVIAATRLRKGSTSSPRGAASFLASTLAVAKRCGATGLVLARMDSAFYTADVVAAIDRAGARFSITARLNRSVKAAIGAIAEEAWTPIHYPNAVFDDQAGGWVSDAEVAETSYTAFTSRGMGRAVTARLIVRRVKLLPGRRRPARPGRRSPLPRRVHRLCVDDAASRDLPPRPRHRRTGDRRPEEWAAGSSAVGEVRRQRRLAGPGRRGAQPDPRRRRLSLGVPRHRPTGHHPRPTDQPAGPDRHLGQTAHAAPAHWLAVGTPLASSDRRDHLNPPSSRPSPTRGPKWKRRADRPTRHAIAKTNNHQDQLQTTESWSVDSG